jgi:YVTN family beta-propeller protein
MKQSFLKLSALVVLIISGTQINAQKTTGYKVINTFHIGSMGGWDYPAVDESSNKLYLSHGMQVNILDKATGDSIGVISNTIGVHGIAFVPALNKGYTSNGRTNNVTIFELSTGKTIGQIATGKNPDWIMYDAFTKRILTSNHSGGDISVIDPSTDAVIATISVGGSKLETIASDNAGKVFVNAEDKNEIVAIDLQKNQVLAHWSLAPGEGPTGLVIDPITKRLFATCDKLLIVMDATNGKIIAELPIGEGCDGAAFDPSSKLIFTSNGEGTITVVKEIDKNTFKVLETLKSKKGARTITIDVKTHKLYLPTADFETPAKDGSKERPKMIPGTFQVLVYSINK